MVQLNRYSLPGQRTPAVKAPQSLDDEMLTSLAKQKMAAQPMQAATPSSVGLSAPAVKQPASAPPSDGLLAGYQAHLTATGAAQPTPASPIKTPDALNPNATPPPAPVSVGHPAPPTPPANPAPAAIGFVNPPPSPRPVPSVQGAAPAAPTPGVDEGALLSQYRTQQAAAQAAQQQAQNTAAQAAQNSLQATAQEHANAAAAQAQTATTTPAAAGGAQNPPSLGTLAQLQLDQQKQTAAATTQLAVDKARALQNAGAASGLGGLGLSGASSTLQGDIRSSQDRNAVTTLGNLATQQHTDQFQQLQRQTALWDVESAENLDLDGDGKVGAPTNAAKSTEGLVKQAGGNTKPISTGQVNADGSYKATPPGSLGQPYVVTQDQLNAAQEAAGSNFKKTVVGVNTIYTAPDGTNFIVQQ